jgi:ABC-2 type transport system ATP-binding protein
LPAIVTQQLVKHFSPDIRAVDGIDLDVPEGQIFAFLGQNGSGKTTTVRMLTTLLHPTSGHAEVGGIDVQRHPARVREIIGVALQEVGLDDLQTGRELLTLQARLYGLRGGDGKQRVNHLLSVVDLEDAADRAVKGYSGGMKRRLDLAAALVHRPRVIFLDEPTTGLDPISREAVWRYVQQLNQEEGVTFFLTTQYLEEADRLAGYVTIIDAGKVVAEGSPGELKASIGLDVVTIRTEETDDLVRARELLATIEGLNDIREVAKSLVIYLAEGARAVPSIVRALDEAAIPIADLTLARPTLDDVFLRKTGHHIEADTQPVAGGAA